MRFGKSPSKEIRITQSSLIRTKSGSSMEGQGRMPESEEGHGRELLEN
jgi:hypothetical protein